MSPAAHRLPGKFRHQLRNVAGNLKLLFKVSQGLGRLGGSAVKCLPSAAAMTSGSWDRVPAPGTASLCLARPSLSGWPAAQQHVVSNPCRLRLPNSTSSLRHKHKDAVTSHHLQEGEQPREQSGNGPNGRATSTTETTLPRDRHRRAETADTDTGGATDGDTATGRGAAGGPRAVGGATERRQTRRAPPAGGDSEDDRAVPDADAARPRAQAARAARKRGSRETQHRPRPRQRERGRTGTRGRERAAGGGRADGNAQTGARADGDARPQETVGKAPSLGDGRTDGPSVRKRQRLTRLTRRALTGQRPARAPTPRAGAEDRRTRTARRLTWPRSKHRPATARRSGPLPGEPSDPTDTALRPAGTGPRTTARRRPGPCHVALRNSNSRRHCPWTGAIGLDCRPPRTAPPIPEGSALSWK